MKVNGFESAKLSIQPIVKVVERDNVCHTYRHEELRKRSPLVIATATAHSVEGTEYQRKVAQPKEGMKTQRRTLICSLDKYSNVAEGFEDMHTLFSVAC